MNKHAGFTLIEMIMALVIMAVIASFLSGLIIQPWNIYEHSSARGKEVAKMSQFLDQIEFDIQNAIPNSVRSHNGGTYNALELFATVAKGRYRDSGSRALEPAVATNSIDILQQLSLSSWANTRLVLNNVSNGASLPGQLYYDAINANAASGIGVVSADDVTISASQCATPAPCQDTSYVTELSLSANWTFVRTNCAPGCVEGSPLGSPSRRIYVTSGAVLYQCNLTSGEIRRHRDYTLATSMASYSAISTGSSGLILNNVIACQFDFAPGSSARAGLVDISITVNHPLAGSIHLQRQVQLVNAS